MTKEEFEQGYASRSRVSVEWLHDRGLEVRPCECGDETCDGWQMVNVADFDLDEAMRAEAVRSSLYGSIVPLDCAWDQLGTQIESAT